LYCFSKSVNVVVDFVIDSVRKLLDIPFYLIGRYVTSTGDSR